jgi:hypothetical protein
MLRFPTFRSSQVGNRAPHATFRITPKATAGVGERTSVLERPDPSGEYNAVLGRWIPQGSRELSTNLFLKNAFSAPQRFRFNHLGEKVINKFGADIAGRFADGSEPDAPFQYFIAQASTTVEAQAPTLYSSNSRSKKRWSILCAHRPSYMGQWPGRLAAWRKRSFNVGIT